MPFAVRLPSVVCACAFVFFASTAAAQSVFINELHYDNASTDAGEAVEIAGPAGTDLTGCRIVLYNGANGEILIRKNLVTP